MTRFEESLRAISAATDGSAVAELVRECFSSILPSELAALPLPCQALLRTDIGDVMAAAVIFARAELSFEGSAVAAQSLHELSYALLVAAARIAQLS
jgi:hypothetical protein